MYMVVGASGRAIAESAARADHRVFTIDYFGDRDTRYFGPAFGLKTDLGLKPSVQNLLEAAQRLAKTPSVLSNQAKPLGPAGAARAPDSGTTGGAVWVEGLIPGSGPENQPQALRWWEERGLLMGNPVAALEKARDPWVLKTALAQIGVRMPPFWAAAEWKSAQSIPERGVSGGRWLLKPLGRGGGHGIRFLAGDPKAARAQIESLAFPERWLVQKFTPGVSASATFLADGRHAILVGTSRQITGTRQLGARPFGYAGNLVPWRLSSPKQLHELAHLADHLTQAWNLRGLNTLDFIANRQGIWVLELNPRWSASVELIEAWQRRPLFGYHLAACKNELDAKQLDYQERAGSPAAADRPAFWGKAIVYARRPVEVKAPGLALEDLLRQGFRDLPTPGTMILPGQPICTVLAPGSTEWMCRQNLLARAEQARTIMGEEPGGDAIAHPQRRVSNGSYF